MSIWKILSGIFSIAVSLLMAFQAFIPGLFRMFPLNGEISITFTLLFAALMLVGGVVAIASRDAITNIGNIVLIITYGIAAIGGYLLAEGNIGPMAWATWCLICAVAAAMAIAADNICGPLTYIIISVVGLSIAGVGLGKDFAKEKVNIISDIVSINQKDKQNPKGLILTTDIADQYIESVRAYQNTLRSPSSFRIHGDILALSFDESTDMSPFVLLSVVCDSWKNPGAYSEKGTIEIWREDDNPPFFVSANDSTNFFNARHFYQIVPDIMSSEESTKEMVENAKTFHFEVIDGQKMADAVGCKFVDDVEITETPGMDVLDIAPYSSNVANGEQNALNKAERYLDSSPFSYSGLVKQLEYEGFSTEEAVFAASHCGADWSEQAAKKARQYLDSSPFSYRGLIAQLEYEGFLPEEAVYAVNCCGADWNEQAAKKARGYLEISPFSRAGLIEQLEYEGFTHSQAVYGVNTIGS